MIGRYRSLARLALSRLAMAMIASWLFSHQAYPAAAQPSTEPPTIEKVIIEESGASQIEGEGRPGDLVEIVSGDVALGQTTVSAGGQWRVELKDGFEPGTHRIRADARSGGAKERTAGDEIRVAIPAELSGRAVVQYDGAGSEQAQVATRERAEALAEGAGQAFDALTQNAANTSAGDDKGSSQVVQEKTVPAQQDGVLAVVIEWLKRSAKTYREDVVEKLGVVQPKTDAANAEPQPPTDASATSAQAASDTIAKERAEAETRRTEVAEADTVRKRQQSEQAAADAAQKEALKRKQAEDLARKKAEADRRIAEELEKLKKAKEEADRAKSREQAAPQQKATITLERFYLPGEKRPKEQTSREKAADANTAGEVRAPHRCAQGRLERRRGQRWYVTGADDTLWDIAERFYGTGLAYPRIYRVNRKRLASPHVVRPCLALRLPGRG